MRPGSEIVLRADGGDLRSHPRNQVAMILRVGGIRRTERRCNVVGHFLTDSELDLVIDLLQAESKRLSVETRRTDARGLRKEIRERERTVDRIVERFREIRAGSLSARTGGVP